MTNPNDLRATEPPGPAEQTSEPRPGNPALLPAFGFIQRLAETGGPSGEDFPILESLFEELHAKCLLGEIASDEMSRLRALLRQVAPEGTIQRHSLRRPYGYSGDFEIIDRIYLRTVSDGCGAAWDRFFHSQKAPEAVRNRKAYFKDAVLCAESRRSSGGVPVLDVASGPCRDLAEYFGENPASHARFTCIDADKRAIAHARSVLGEHAGRVAFHHVNAFRFRNRESYDLIWSGGLFDYLTDRQFTRLLGRLFGMLNPGGELVVGNFAPENPSRGYMELAGDWHLIHRSPSDLCRLALNSGVPFRNLRIDHEPLRINLFLHLSA
jgi:extracellular factor (EF) 3-hydroxypalmitic acid methyl ester biosynthesis protein